MTEFEKQRAGFATLVHAVDALVSLVDRSDVDPMTLKGVKVMGQVRDATLPPELAKQVFHAVLNTLREVCVQGSKATPIILPEREIRQ